jgi:adenylate cyclase
LGDHLLERRLTAVLAADVVGYSRLMSEDQDGTLASLRQLRTSIFDLAIADHRGALIKSMGDGWIVEFPSITDAAECALQVQRSSESNPTIKLRIGIHIGEVVFEGSDIFGDGVNVAARLEALAEPGQILLSDSAYNSLDQKRSAQFAGG